MGCLPQPWGLKLDTAIGPMSMLFHSCLGDHRGELVGSWMDTDPLDDTFTAKQAWHDQPRKSELSKLGVETCKEDINLDQGIDFRGGLSIQLCQSVRSKIDL